MGGPPSWMLGEVLTTLHRKECHATKYSQLPRAWTDLLVRRKHWKGTKGVFTQCFDSRRRRLQLRLNE